MIKLVIVSVSVLISGVTSPSPEVSDADRAAQLCLAVAIPPECLAVAGVQFEDFGGWQDTAIATETYSDNRLSDAISEAEKAEMIYKYAWAHLQANLDDQAAKTALEDASADLMQKQEAITLARKDLRDALIEPLPDSKEQLLKTSLANHSRGVPAELTILTLTDQQWEDLRRSLDAEKRANRKREVLDPATATLLAGYRARDEVIGAKRNLDACVADLRSGYESVLSDAIVR